MSKIKLNCMSVLQNYYNKINNIDNNLCKKISAIVRYTYNIPVSLLWRWFALFPITNTAVLCSFRGRDYSDNPKYIAEELIQRKYFDEIIWLVSDEKLLQKNNLPDEITPVLTHSTHRIYKQATAKVWIDNQRQPFYVYKRKKQLYVQTWHGTDALKKIEADIEKVSQAHRISAKHDSKMIDCIIAGSKHHSKIHESAFWYDGEILESGSPKCDILSSSNVTDNEDLVRSIKLSIFHNELDNDTHIALYAPTFRRDSNLDVYSLDYSACKLALEQKFGGNWVFLVRLHPNIIEKSNELHLCNKYITDVSSYPDMQELMCISDILITDYSSSMFDYQITRKPCLLYMPDYDDYMDDRGYYYTLDELPFPIAKTNNELVELISNFDMNQYMANIDKFAIYSGLYVSDHASKDVVDWILNKIQY